jgi:hypothetical protein
MKVRRLILTTAGVVALLTASIGPVSAAPAGLCETLSGVPKAAAANEQVQGVIKAVLARLDCPA